MQHFRLKVATVAVIGALAALPAEAQVPCNSATYAAMQQASVNALQARNDHVQSLFDRVNQMSVDRMACLDIFKNLSFGGFFKWMSFSQLVDAVVNAFWNKVCNAAAGAYAQATSGLNSALSKNLTLPGQIGQVMGPVVQGGVNYNGGSLSGGSGGTSTQLNSYQVNGNASGVNQSGYAPVDPFASRRDAGTSQQSGVPGINMYR